VTATDHGGGHPDVQTSPDQSSGDDVSTGPETGGPEAAADAGKHDGSTLDAAKEVGVDAPAAEAAPEAAADVAQEAAPDAPPDVAAETGGGFDSGCGPLNSVLNCSACGDTCAPVSASVTSAACPGAVDGTGATCSYTCATGYLDCDGLTNPPNLNGCECHVPGATPAQCCAASGGDCPVQHHNGLNQTSSIFYDCVPTGTMSAQLAQDACIAYVGAANAVQCQQYTEGDASVPDSYCSGSFTGDCVCWTYSGVYVGTVFDAQAQGAPDPTQCYYGFTATTFN
jgi:hypothetical protein